MSSGKYAQQSDAENCSSRINTKPTVTAAAALAADKYTPDDNRGRWASKTEFILSCLGYAVGLGNVWRFPYLCYRSGGGAFLVPYLLMLFFCGIPLFFMEIIMGQFSSLGCIGIFRLAPLFKGAGYAIVVVNIICTVYYSVIIAYPLMFLKHIFTAKLPWESCGNAWNTEHCIEVTEMANRNFTNRGDFKTPADEFFHLEILKISKGIDEIGTIQWPLFFGVLIAWIMVYVCIIKGIETVGKVVYFTATFPFIILFILFIRGVTLPGATKGILFYIYPEWSRLLDLKVWADAAIQIFFSLGPGWGGIVNMASFNNFRNNAKGDSIYIPIINCSTSIFAGFVVFSVLGFLSHQTGIPVATVATSGPGLAFITYPQAISMLPFSQLWAGLFFTMLFLLGLDSVFVQIEAIISSILDEIPKVRPYKFAVTLISCILMFLMSIILTTNGGMFILQLLDWYSASVSVILICIFEIVMVGWIYGVDNFIDDIYFMIGKKPERIWRYCWKYITPFILVTIFFTTIIFNRPVRYNDRGYPEWAIIVGWCSCAISILCIPLYMLKKILLPKGSLKENFLRSLQAKYWLPAQDDYRLAYNEFKNSQKIMKELNMNNFETLELLKKVKK
ncbi:sodium- and chloride-dependent glycine transporter 1 [Lucilia cuprina]|uniref:sodium- and chloride-dependent glycine transporter 1 n=1 Tax=Lucilia cuprina TaxID=7375 RepID=UPI001F05388B|nr:sodium- and chloride-dependent glycine transporter 1 [Lucilia cuprina]